MQKAKCIVVATFVLGISLSSCGHIPTGDVTITLRSGQQLDTQLLAVDSNAAIIRSQTAPLESQLQKIPFDSIAHVRRLGDVSTGAVISLGILGAVTGLAVAAALAPPAQPGLVDLGREFYFLGAIPAGVTIGALLGAFAGSVIHKPARIISSPDAYLREHLQSLALYPNGIPANGSLDSTVN